MSRRPESGYSVLELLVTFAVASVVMGFVAFNMKSLKDPVRDGAGGFLGLLKRARAKSLATTYAYTLYPTDSQHVAAKFGVNCADTDTEVDTLLTFELEGEAEFADTTWTVCYSSRGISDDNVEITIGDESISKTIEVALGGAARIQ